jgi:hypothetical protein
MLAGQEGEDGAISIARATMTPPGKDNTRSAQCGRGDVIIILWTYRICDLPKNIRIGRAVREQIDDFQPTIAPSPTKGTATTQRRIVRLSVSQARIEQDPQQGGTAGIPCPPQLVAVRATHSSAYEAIRRWK